VRATIAIGLRAYGLGISNWQTTIDRSNQHDLLQLQHIEEGPVCWASVSAAVQIFGKQKIHFVVLAADFVSADDGTGIVHIAAGFGEEDLEIWRLENCMDC
jgi:isoleucyl-tRNA synthetase